MSDPRIAEYREWLEREGAGNARLLKMKEVPFDPHFAYDIHEGLVEMGSLALDKFNALFPPEPPVVPAKCISCGAEYDDWVDQFNCNDCVQASFRKQNYDV